VTPADGRRQPTGPPFLAALLLRNLAKTLRSEIALDAPVSEAGMDEKKKQLQEERYGLPIPDSVLLEEEEEARNLVKASEDVMTFGQRERAMSAFQCVEERVLDVLETNMGGLGSYLTLVVGW
jgi:chromatin structure-remodeling complex subunit RSC9